MKERKVYTVEFKREAVRLSEQAGVSVAQIAQELGVSDYSFYKWRKQARESGELAFPGNGKVALTAEQQENVRLKRELERVKQERDILKNRSWWRTTTQKDENEVRLLTSELVNGLGAVSLIKNRSLATYRNPGMLP